MTLSASNLWLIPLLPLLAAGIGALTPRTGRRLAASSAILSSEFRPAPSQAPVAGVRQIGLELMHRHGAALLIVGVILTVALIGATILAATDTKPEDAP